MMHVEPSWNALKDKIVSTDVRKIYLVGGPDSGKSTLAAFLVQELSQLNDVGLVDCDPGQSTLGLPTTVNAGIFTRGDPVPQQTFTRFIGDTSPQRRQAAVLLALHRLAQKLEEASVQTIIFDSSGYALGCSATEFQAAVIELLQPEMVVFLKRGEELESLENQIRAMSIPIVEALPVSSSVHYRSMPVRKEIRESKYQAYFEQAEVRVIDVKNMVLCGALPERFTVQTVRGRILAFCDQQKFVVALGVARSVYESDQICICLIPEFDSSKAKFVHFGDIFLTPQFKEETPQKI